MNEQPVRFPADELKLEGLLAIPSDPPVRAAVVCHPHPQYGGSMYNNVVEAILDGLWALGFATLRFNFRGVGESEGHYAGGSGETRDALAALNFIAGQPAVRSDGLVLAGYSFGAMVAMRAGAASEKIETVVAVAPPVSVMDHSFAAGSGKRMLLFAGDRDDYCSVAGLSEFRSRLSEESQLKVIAGTDHFFGGYERQLSAALREGLQKS